MEHLQMINFFKDLKKKKDTNSILPEVECAKMRYKRKW